MELTVFLKILLDCCAFLICAGYVTSLFTPVTLLTGAAIFVSLSAAGCYLTRDREGVMRFLPLIISLPGWLFVNTYADAALTGLLSCYLVYICVKKLYLNDDDDFKTSFQRTLGLCLLFCIICALSMRFDKLNNIMLPYIFVMIPASIALMRILRHNRETIDSRAFKLSNILTVGLVCAVTLVLSSPAFIGTVKSVTGFIYLKCAVPVLTAFIYAMARFLSLFSGLFAWIFNKEVKQYDTSSSAVGGRDDLSFEEDVLVETPQIVIWLFFAIVAAAVIFIIIKAFKALAGKNRRFDEKSAFSTSRETIELAKEGRKSPFARRDEREKVRHQYRKFLRECLERGFGITKEYDTAQIAVGAEEFFPGAPLEDLRRVYIKARYSDAEVTKEDAEEAGRLVSDVKSRKVIKDGK